MYGVRVLRENGLPRQWWEGTLVGSPTKGDWSQLQPFTADTLAEAQAKANQMQSGMCKVLYTPIPLPCVIQ